MGCVFVVCEDCGVVVVGVGVYEGDCVGVGVDVDD